MMMRQFQKDKRTAEVCDADSGRTEGTEECEVKLTCGNPVELHVIAEEDHIAVFDAAPFSLQMKQAVFLDCRLGAKAISDSFE